MNIQDHASLYHSLAWSPDNLTHPGWVTSRYESVSYFCEDNALSPVRRYAITLTDADFC